MIAKCPCQQCGVNIEFDAEQANQFVACPSCGSQTRLLIPSGSPLEQRLSPAESLKQIRQQTCYGALRSLIRGAQIFCFITATLPVLAGVFGFFSEVKDGGLIAVAGGIIAIVIASAFWVIIFVFLAIAGGQCCHAVVSMAEVTECVLPRNQSFSGGLCRNLSGGRPEASSSGISNSFAYRWILLRLLSHLSSLNFGSIRARFRLMSRIAILSGVSGFTP